MVRNQAKRLHGPRIAQGASTTSPDPAPSYRSKRSPLERATEVDLGDRGERFPPERATRVDLGDRGERSPPERATGVDLGDRGERSPPERAIGVDFESLLMIP